MEQDLQAAAVEDEDAPDKDRDKVLAKVKAKARPADAWEALPPDPAAAVSVPVAAKPSPINAAYPVCR